MSVKYGNKDIAANLFGDYVCQWTFHFFSVCKGDLQTIKVSYMEKWFDGMHTWYYKDFLTMWLLKKPLKRQYVSSPIMLSCNIAFQADTWVQERWFKLPPLYNLEDKCTVGMHSKTQ